jgi:hypothetical protein
MPRRTLLTAIVAVGLSACRSEPPPDRYAFLSAGPLWGDELRDTVAKLPYQSIAISRSACLGSCPVYSAILYFNGNATYEGKHYVEHAGSFSGGVSLLDFGQLSRLIELSGFKTLDARYEEESSDLPTTTITVTTKAGHIKTVERIRLRGPAGSLGAGERDRRRREPDRLDSKRPDQQREAPVSAR